MLAENKRRMVSARLNRRLRALGLESFEAYLDLLDGPDGADEAEEFANAVTTNLTAFFRERHHFDHLRDQVLAPRLRAGRTAFRIWSAGCSSGEEPYSILLAARAAGALPPRGDLRLAASDIDTRMLARARAGRYREDQVADLPPELRAGALLRDGETGVRVSDALRAAVDFRRVNLHERWPFSGPFDAIFCRNVLIYFDADAKAALIQRFVDALREDGALYLGHSESLLGGHPELISEGRTIYRRRR